MKRNLFFTQVQVCIALSCLFLLSCHKQVEDVSPSSTPVKERKSSLTQLHNQLALSFVSLIKTELQSDQGELRKISIDEDVITAKEREYLSAVQALQEAYPFPEQGLANVEQVRMSVEDSLWSILESASDPSYDLFSKHIQTYTNSKEFLSYPVQLQEWILHKLQSIEATRIPVLIALRKESASTSEFRMSPGDRMIWSEAAAHMSKCQLDAAMKLNAAGIALPFVWPVPRLRSRLINMIIDWVKEFSRGAHDCEKAKKRPPHGKVEFGPSKAWLENYKKTHGESRPPVPPKSSKGLPGSK